ncbi:RNA polymerase sigma factor [Luteibacter aegosomaticola]|uniref:RNA polymerase sigma factor n=1 Tax=Luteibacter aegosomaticola TaxID=2911538 RepID=UPI001FF81439|nr:RNA polymerase sigma factor [Luteibacter aegosomaticola]UPG88101.1 RNA polymerase sigma factor [Luteibacter aegosomaticola]
MPDPSAGLATVLLEQDGLLQRYIHRRAGHAWDAQDLVQETYLRLLSADPESIQNPEAYLFTVATNLLRQRAGGRLTGGREDSGLDDVFERLATPCEAASGVDQERRSQRLQELMGRLSPKCRAVMVLHYRDDLSYREIADQLDISVHMVKKYIVKGLAACRQGMGRYE